MSNKLIVFCFALVFLTSFISASWVIPKTTTCEMMNVTGSSCDALWCNVIECEYDSTLQACVCESESNSSINMTEVENHYWNRTQIENYYFNKTEVEDKIANVSSSENNSGTFVSKEDFLQWKTDIESDFDDLEDDLKYGSSNSDFLGDLDTTTILLIVILIVAAFWYLNKQKSEQKKEPHERGEAPVHYPKIQTKKEMEKESILDEKIKKIEKIQKDLEKKKVKQNKKVVEVEPEEDSDEEDFEEED